MKTPRFVLWSVMLLVAVVGVVAGGEMLVRLVSPQSLSSGWFENGPRGLVVNVAGAAALHEAGDARIRYRFNRLHQRGGPPDPAAVRILALGDSFTFGWMVEEAECFVGLLERQANRAFGDRRFQLLNAGTGGWGTADALAYLESFGGLANPRAILLFINFDDVERSWRRGLYMLKDPIGAELVARDAPVEGAGFIRRVRSLPGYGWVVRRSHLLQLLRNLLVRQGGLGSPPPVDHVGQAGTTGVSVEEAGRRQRSESAEEDGKRRLMRGLLRRFGQWADAHGVPLFVVTTGWPSRSLGWLAEIARTERVDFFDSGPAVADRVGADRPRYTLTGDDHPNAAGHRLIADAMWPWLEPRLAGLRQEGGPSAGDRVR